MPDPSSLAPGQTYQGSGCEFDRVDLCGVGVLSVRGVGGLWDMPGDVWDIPHSCPPGGCGEFGPERGGAGWGGQGLDLHLAGAFEESNKVLGESNKVQDGETSAD